MMDCADQTMKFVMEGSDPIAWIGVMNFTVIHGHALKGLGSAGRDFR